MPLSGGATATKLRIGETPLSGDAPDWGAFAGPESPVTGTARLPSHGDAIFDVPLTADGAWAEKGNFIGARICIGDAARRRTVTGTFVCVVGCRRSVGGEAADMGGEAADMGSR